MRTKQTAVKSTGGKAPRKFTGDNVLKANVHVPQRVTSSKVVAMPGIKKPHRYKPGTVALREIRSFQKSTDLLLRRTAFKRLVREVTQDIKNDVRWQNSALEALHEASEAYLIGLLADAQLCAVHSKRNTVTVADMNLTKKLRGDSLETQSK